MFRISNSYVSAKVLTSIIHFSFYARINAFFFNFSDSRLNSIFNFKIEILLVHKTKIKVIKYFSTSFQLKRNIESTLFQLLRIYICMYRLQKTVRIIFNNVHIVYIPIGFYPWPLFYFNFNYACLFFLKTQHILG